MREPSRRADQPDEACEHQDHDEREHRPESRNGHQEGSLGDEGPVRDDETQHGTTSSLGIVYVG
jgi:hypothetical protein